MKNRVNLSWYGHALPTPLFEEFWHHLSFFLKEEGFDDVPEKPDTSDDVDAVLRNQTLLLSQTCGYDIPHNLPSPLQVVGMPIYNVSGCEAGLYTSYIVSHQTSKIRLLEQLRNTRLVVNSFRSYSGYHSLLKKLQVSGNKRRYFSEITVSGSHKVSLEAIQDHLADVASIDKITWELFKLYQPGYLKGVQIIGETSPAPAPPFVTASHASPVKVNGLQNAFFNFFQNSKSRKASMPALLKGMKLVDRQIYNSLKVPGAF